MFAKFNIKNITNAVKTKAQEATNNYVRKKSGQGCKSCGKKRS